MRSLAAARESEANAAAAREAEAHAAAAAAAAAEREATAAARAAHWELDALKRLKEEQVLLDPRCMDAVSSYYFSASCTKISMP